MIAKSYILRNLNEINALYNKSTNHKKELYYSKLALYGTLWNLWLRSQWT